MSSPDGDDPSASKAWQDEALETLSDYDYNVLADHYKGLISRLQEEAETRIRNANTREMWELAELQEA